MLIVTVIRYIQVIDASGVMAVKKTKEWRALQSNPEVL
ncbi:hypothetical protein EBBID32_13230 [Sphingobium indicum BiD32]|uniref:Uncharacterized protein n=1 Tax=Sphingobium indicum BiD32 TaxID=1301087 RepID=N1MJP5_9SPHN|nr:hypothetical protein EBBID32_13230 [Sphingobium indicum BiD32]